MHLFYATSIDGEVFELSPEESRHAVQVMRLKEGDLLKVTDGKGSIFEASMRNLNPRRCEIGLTGNVHTPIGRPFRLHMAVAPTKNIQRFEWFLEKATELGIDEITPILCQRSERKHIQLERLHRVIVAAAKQSLCAKHPIVQPMTPLKDLLAKGFSDGYLAHCLADSDERVLLQTAYQPGANATILIGPEGDFSSEEIDRAKECGLQSITLGESRLRTETAAIAACHTINLLNQ